MVCSFNWMALHMLENNIQLIKSDIGFKMIHYYTEKGT